MRSLRLAHLATFAALPLSGALAGCNHQPVQDPPQHPVHAVGTPHHIEAPVETCDDTTPCAAGKTCHGQAADAPHAGTCE